MKKIKLTRVVLCEGKYDKIKLSSVIDGMILTTDGFSVFRNHEKQLLLRKLCETRGMIILTDSDKAGFFIRNKLKGMLPADKVTHLYIPEIKGREKRKSKASKEGLLGVEGMEVSRLRSLLMDAGLCDESEEVSPVPLMTKAELYEMGLSGGQDSALKREEVCRALDLPASLSANGFMEACAMLRIDRTAVEAILRDMEQKEEGHD